MKHDSHQAQEKATILVVDDEESIRSQLKWALAEEYRVLSVGSIEETLKLVEEEDLKLITLDISLSNNGDADGMKILEKIVRLNSRIKIIMITGNDDRSLALKAIQLGAFDYYQKPIITDELKIIIKRALHIQRLERENEELVSHFRNETQFEDIIGDCPQMLDVYETLKKVICTDVPVLIYGESGTGKELVARAIHFQSARKQKPFVAINCAAIPENLLESELFGYEKGAFTGAYCQRKGKFETAHEGTAFLDEIGELSPNLQVKILRFLQEKEIERVGGRQPISVDVRIVAATHKNLENEMEKENFRPDLFYRLSVVSIELPPLRDRGDDILLLATSFLIQYSKEYDKKNLQFDSLAIEKLKAYSWPGNIREMENRIKRAVIMSKSKFIYCEDLGFDEKLRSKKITLEEVIEDVQKKHMLRALQSNHGNISKTAEELGMSRVTLYEMINKYKINVEMYRKIHSLS